MSKSGENYNFYNTVLSYGLNQEEKEYIDGCIADKGFKHLSCEAYEDVLAVPAGIIIIRFAELSEKETASFNECFSESHAAIIAVDSFPIDNHFAYFGDIDLLDEEGTDGLLLLRILTVLDKKERAANITIDDNTRYSAASISGTCLKISEFEGFKLENTTEYDLEKMECPKQIDNLIFYNPCFTYGGEVYDLQDKSNGYIHMHLLLGCEYPVTSVMDLDGKIEYFYPEKEHYLNLSESDKMMILLRMYFDDQKAAS